MLIDNRTQNQTYKINTLYDFFKKNIDEGNLDVVSGFFSIEMLAEFYQDFQKVKKFRMVLDKLVQNPKIHKAQIDLLAQTPNILKVMQLSQTAKKAVEFLQQDKFELKTYKDKFCHAKAYIYENEQKPNDSFFSIGSSNFTYAGLKEGKGSNIELNHVQTGTSPDLKEYQKWFENLWENEATDLIESQENENETISYKKYIISLIEKLYVEYSPEDIYYKILFELFYDELKEQQETTLQKQKLKHLEETNIWQRLFDFQKKGVLSLLQMLQKYNGAILADAVGLGKTWEALAVIKFFELEGYKTIVLCPKKLEHNWEKYREGHNSIFEDDNFRYIVRYHSDLQDKRLENQNQYQKINNYFQGNSRILFVIDESHNLRNDTSNRYKFLVNTLLDKESSKNKDVKVLMLSATPINTKITDIRNQFKLIVRGKDDGFKQDNMPHFSISSLENLFGNVQKKFNQWQKTTDDKKLSDFIAEVPRDFFKLTDGLVVARTRSMIKKYELDKDSLVFPKTLPPINIYHTPDNFGELDTEEKVLKALEGLFFWGYQPAKFEKEKEEDWKKKGTLHNEALRQGFLARMMFFLLVKRLESSWYSFYKTLNNILSHHLNALDKVNKYLKEKNQNEDFEIDTDWLDEEMQEELSNFQNQNSKINVEDLTIGKKRKVLLNEMKRINDFARDLEAECKRLSELAKNVKIFEKELNEGSRKDKKIEALINEIKEKRKNSNNQKVLIFTAFKDTAEYITTQLRKEFKNETIEYIAGDTQKSKEGFEPILEQFAPYTKLFKEGNWIDDFIAYKYPKQNIDDKEKIRKNVSFDEWKEYVINQNKEIQEKLDNPIHILVATDCLSEGQNLQDCDCVVNYDIHWNPVRIIQRFGRIDRLGSPNAEVKGINFWIGKSYEESINLKKRVEKRMAIMALAGTETINELTDEMKEIMTDNPLISEQEEKMLEQMKKSWEDIEINEKSLSMADFSLQIFREELWDYMNRQKERLENMPNGIFSGFLYNNQNNNTKNIKNKNIIALLKHKKEKNFLLLFTNQDGESIFINDFNILNFLRENKKQERKIKVNIDDNSLLQVLADMLGKNIENQAEKEANDFIDNLSIGNFNPKQEKKQELTEDYFKRENFDLITWEIIQTI